MTRIEVRGETTIVVRRAREPRCCLMEVGYSECGRTIAKGEEYADQVAPPWHEFNPNPGHSVWWPA